MSTQNLNSISNLIIGMCEQITQTQPPIKNLEDLKSKQRILINLQEEFKTLAGNLCDEEKDLKKQKRLITHKNKLINKIHSCIQLTFSIMDYELTKKTRYIV